MSTAGRSRTGCGCVSKSSMASAACGRSTCRCGFVSRPLTGPQGGWDIEQSVELSRAARARGVDLVDCSSGGAVPAQIPVAPGYQVPFAARIKAEAGVATGAVGLDHRSESSRRRRPQRTGRRGAAGAGLPARSVLASARGGDSGYARDLACAVSACRARRISSAPGASRWLRRAEGSVPLARPLRTEQCDEFVAREPRRPSQGPAGVFSNISAAFCRARPCWPPPRPPAPPALTRY